MGLNNYFDREKNATNTSYLKRRFGISESASEDILKDAKVRRSEVGTNPVSLGMKTFGTVEVADTSSLLDEKDDVPSFMQMALDTIEKSTKTRKKALKKFDPDPESGSVATKRQDEMQGPMLPPTKEQTSAKYAGDAARTRESIDNLKERFPKIPKYQVDAIFQGESGGVSTAKNPETNASGLWQIMGNALKDLRDYGYVGKGTTLADIRAMSKADQIDLYGDYLARWNYDGSESLGMMQAAPALAKKAVNNPDMVVYKKGSTAWNQNPAWRPADGGDITPRSIDAYYFGSAPEKSLLPKLRPFVEKKV